MPSPASPGLLLRTFQIGGFVVRNSHLSINSPTSTGLVYALTGFTFVCGDYRSPWTSEYFHGWCAPWQCLLGYLTVPPSSTQIP